MAYTTQDKFSFVSTVLPPDTFGAIKFTGHEGLSQCYRFEILLASNQSDLDLKAILKNPAVFTVHREDDDVPFHGILSEFQLLHNYKNVFFYRAVLVPRFWWLSLTFHNQVFLNMKMPDILGAVLKDGGLTDQDFEMRLLRDYPVWEYVCQYRESHFDFVSRWMERDGMYYFFEQGAAGEKLVITDTYQSHVAMPQGREVIFSPTSGLEGQHLQEIVEQFHLKQKALPQNVFLKDYNYRTPSLEISGQAPVSVDGRGEIYIYGEHFRTPEEGDNLAQIRAEEFLCREKVFSSQSTVPFIRPGFTFELSDHFRDDFNSSFLTTEVDHEGNQVGYLISGLREAFSERDQDPYYRNSFSAMPAELQYRPERKTPKARFFGSINAVIDAPGTGTYAELDKMGRYKVVMPFDLSGRQNGKASAYLRMMQPYGGSGHGMHFPLHKGTEVLLTFIDGDPDRPIITGAVPNPETPSLINDHNQSQCAITTSGQNKFHIEDKQGQQRMLMHSPTQNTWIRIGSPNDPPAPDLSGVGATTSSSTTTSSTTTSTTTSSTTTTTTESLEDRVDELEKWQEEQEKEKEEEEKDGWHEQKNEGFAFATEGHWNGTIKESMSVELGGNSTKVVGGGEEIIIMGFDNKTVLGAKTDLTVGGEVGICLALQFEYKPAWVKMLNEKFHMHNTGTELSELETKIHEESTHLKEQYTQMISDTLQMMLQKTSLIEDKTEAIEQRTTALENDTELAESVEKLSTSVTKLTEEKTELLTSHNKLVEEKNELATQINVLTEMLVELTEDHTILAESHNVLASECGFI